MESSINAVTHLGGGAICQKVTLHYSMSLFSNHWYGPEGLENSTSELINSMLFWGKTPLPSLSSLPKFLVNLWIAVEWFCSEWHAQPRTAKLYLLTTNQEHVENLQTASRIGSTLITRHPWLVKLSTLNLSGHVEYLVSKNRSGELNLTMANVIFSNVTMLPEVHLNL